MKKFNIEIVDCQDKKSDYFVLVNNKKVELTKTPQGKRGCIRLDGESNLLEIRKKYYLDNPFGAIGVFFLWIKYLITESFGEEILEDGKYFYKFKMRFNLEADSNGKFYIMDKRNPLINPVSCEMFSSIKYTVIENKSTVNDKAPINYGIYSGLKYLFSVAILCGFILLFIK